MPNTDNACSDSAASAVTATQSWLATIVIGENFCPFAKREFERNTISYKAEPSAVFQQQVESVLDECHRLRDNDDIETSLIIFTATKAYDDLDVTRFEDFLTLVDAVQWSMDRANFEGELQLATFHPQYLFEGEPDESPSHYTNRAPYPTLHLIREASIERVLRTYKEPESIPARNIEHAVKRGSDFFQHFLASLRS